MKRLFSDFGLKVLALSLAALVWGTVSAARREKLIERTYDVPLALVNVPSDLIVTKGLQPTVSVRLRGPLSTLRSMSSQNLEATVDLSDLRAGEVSVFIRPQYINIPEGSELVSISPAKLSLSIEPRRQKAVAVRPFLVGDPPNGYAVFNVSIEPESALVSGPASAVRDISELGTERIILSGRTDNFSLNVAIVSERPLVRVVEPQNARVTVLMERTGGSEPLVTATDTTATSTSAIQSERIAPAPATPSSTTP